MKSIIILEDKSLKSLFFTVACTYCPLIDNYN